jgi:hypothetical protein
MTRQVSKPNIFWAPSLETARKIDDEDTIETARYRFTASMADLERCYDEQASKLRSAFVAEVAALYQSEAHNRKPLPGSRQGFFAKFGGTTMEKYSYCSATAALASSRTSLRDHGFEVNRTPPGRTMFETGLPDVTRTST